MVLGGVHLSGEYAVRARSMSDSHLRQLRLRHVKRLIEAESFEEAAKIYESLGMWKEAGETRRMTRRQVVTHVQVNLNDLMEHLRKGGLTTIYTCPGCGGPIHVSGATSMAALKSCQYCGAIIQTTDLTDFLSLVVGR